MGQDEIYLEVLRNSGDEKEQLYAGKVLRLLKRGKHWVLVTLLLSNVITNETLPIVLDRSLGGGWPAVVSSTALIGRRPISQSLSKYANIIQSSSERLFHNLFVFDMVSPSAHTSLLLY